MRIGVIGTGNIGGNLARLLVGHCHEPGDQLLPREAADGTLVGRVVIDTTNPFVPSGDGFRVLDLGEVSAARLSAAKVPGAFWVKAFNTGTPGFLTASAGRTGEKRVVTFYATTSTARPCSSRRGGRFGIRRGVPPDRRRRRAGGRPAGQPLPPAPQ